MRKTTVYLNSEDAEGLRRLATDAGTSQAELIREAVREVLARGRERRFRSMGVGLGPGTPTPRWDAGDLYRKVTGNA